MDLVDTTPVWKRAKLELNLGPIANFVNGLKSTLQGGGSVLGAANSQAQAVFGRVAEVYTDLKRQEADVKQGVTDAVKNLVQDFNETGLKFIIRSPFVGDLSTLRQSLINVHTQNYDNAPAVSGNSQLASVTLVLSGNKDILDTFIELAKYINLFFGVDVLKEIGGALNAVGSNPLSAPLINNTQIRNQIDDYYKMFLDDEGQPLSDAARSALTYNITPSLQDAAPAGFAQVQSDMAATALLLALSPQAAGDFVTNGIVDFGKTIFNDFSDGVSNVLGSVFTAGLGMLPGDVTIKTGTQYLVVEDDDSEDQFIIAYPANVDLSSQDLLIAQQLQSTTRYTNGRIFIGLDQDTSDSFFNAGTDSTKYQIVSGKGKVIEYSGEKAAALLNSPYLNALNSFRNIQATLNEDPYDKWHDLFSLGDLFGGLTTKLAEGALGVMDEMFKAVDAAGGGIMNVIGYGDYILEQAIGKSEEQTNNIVAMMDKFPTDFNIGAFDLFVVPASPGGLDRVRYQISQFMQPDISGVPNYPPNTIFMPITILGVNVPFLDKMGMLFKEEE